MTAAQEAIRAALARAVANALRTEDFVFEAVEIEDDLVQGEEKTA